MPERQKMRWCGLLYVETAVQVEREVDDAILVEPPVQAESEGDQAVHVEQQYR
jgi:hypothetical protein